MTAKTIIKDAMILSKKSQLATKADQAAGEDLLDTLIANNDKAAGLAANMIGVNKQIIALYIGPFPVLMYNPVITNKKGKYLAKEGCLSLMGEREAVRYQEITVEYLDRNFQAKSQVFSDFVAEVIQHEIDHGAGILI
ncbi:peptide deformylase [Lactobacillus pasteurii DSM 23907 = CRBIP 24.76]|uniref:Peptide deformylase n=1 Tax=Lactobacillus pasteurii DSM 23907 = CRBIP 24.76 TaxID=1423790 RepID=I7LD80_9LACO|nr:peptide deformylase [Lactobacillus pasteurii]KRK07654.1 peptide deformylase [Lactobacillus pasteurii DSM 23907 = CRBIP 24.76]TDG77175.1 hypothetical protein C5L33_000368 [Lactobacillus pasteurii]CCI84658.1 Peptide deformylase [Lactobacillus pasteurii DSM 23907 = CRBIP 24.76]